MLSVVISFRTTTLSVWLCVCVYMYALRCSAMLIRPIYLYYTHLQTQIHNREFFFVLMMSFSHTATASDFVIIVHVDDNFAVAKTKQTHIRTNERTYTEHTTQQLNSYNTETRLQPRLWQLSVLLLCFVCCSIQFKLESWSEHNKSVVAFVAIVIVVLVASLVAYECFPSLTINI